VDFHNESVEYNYDRADCKRSMWNLASTESKYRIMIVVTGERGSQPGIVECQPESKYCNQSSEDCNQVRVEYQLESVDCTRMK
jgi:hypothetical protein